MPRTPRQERSKATREAIVEAGFICVSRHGLGGTTTHHIAEVSGVGVGSVYEYFANKGEIFAAMGQRMVADIAALITELTPQITALDIEPAVQLLLDRFTRLLRRDDERYLKAARHLLHASPDAADYLEEPGKRLMDLLMQYLMAHPQYARLPDLQTMSHILIHGAMFVMLRHLSSERPTIGYEQLSRGTATLIASYFRQRW